MEFLVLFLVIICSVEGSIQSLPKQKWSTFAANLESGAHPVAGRIFHEAEDNLSPLPFSSRSKLGARIGNIYKRKTKEYKAIAVQRVSCHLPKGHVNLKRTQNLREQMIFHKEKSEVVREAEEKFCATRTATSPFSGYIVDIDLQRVEMVISDPSDLPPESVSEDCSKNSHYQNYAFTTRNWIVARKDLAAAFNANFYGMSGHVHVNKCHCNFGLVMRDNSLITEPEFDEFKSFEIQAEMKITKHIVNMLGSYSQFCSENIDVCNVKGAISLIVDNHFGLASVGSYVTRDMLSGLQCIRRSDNSCQGIAGNALVFNGEPVDANELNPASMAMRSRIALGVMDHGRRIRIIVAENYRPGPDTSTVKDPTLKQELHDETLTAVNTKGAKLVEMQHWCILLGLRDCINFDGGGSATLVYQNSRTKLRTSIPEDRIVERDNAIKDRPATTHFGFRYRANILGGEAVGGRRAEEVALEGGGGGGEKKIDNTE